MKLKSSYLIKPHTAVRLSRLTTAETGGFKTEKAASALLGKHRDQLDKLQNVFYASQQKALLIVLQGMDTAGKDGTIRHIFSGVNPEGCAVTSFKVPTPLEARHDFLWRVHAAVPPRGMIGIFNRSHYEDVLVVRVHKMVPKSVWSKRYELINDFEKMLHDAGTRILKFYLHINPEEQLERFEQRLDDPMRNWKISEDDYSERKLWPDYLEAYEEVMEKTSTKHAPWHVIPSNHKWFRDLAISEILADTLEDMEPKLPPATVDIAEIRHKYHAAAARQARRGHKPPKVSRNK